MTVTIVICTLGTDSEPFHLPASHLDDRLYVGGGEQSLYELAFAVAETGRPVELRGALSKPALSTYERATKARPTYAAVSRPPAGDDIVIVPEGWADPLHYAHVALSPARCVMLLLAPPGLFGWPFTEGWSAPDPLTVPLDSLGQRAHYASMTALGFELWTNSRGIEEEARAAGSACVNIGAGWPRFPEPRLEKKYDVAYFASNRWAPLAQRVAAQLHAAAAAIPELGHEEAMDRLSEARILLWPSRVEGRTRISWEARALGTVPVTLSSNVYGAGLNAEEGVLAVDSVDELAPAIQSLLERPHDLRAMADRGVQAARAELNWDRHVARVDAALSRTPPADPGRGARAVWGAELAGRDAEPAARGDGRGTREARLWALEYAARQDQGRAETLARDMETLQRTVSFRVGRALTWPLRRVRDLIRGTRDPRQAADPRATSPLVDDYAEFSGMSRERVLEAERGRYIGSAEEWRRLESGRTWSETARVFYAESRHYLLDLLFNNLDKQVVIDKLDRCNPLILRKIRRHPGRRFLEFGGGVGVFCEIANDAGKEVTYLDLQGPVSAFAQWRFQKRRLPFRVLLSSGGPPELPESYDIIYTDAVFEHVTEPEETLKALVAHLNAGGLLVLIVDLSGPSDRFPMHRAIDIEALHALARAGGCVPAWGEHGFASMWTKAR